MSGDPALGNNSIAYAYKLERVPEHARTRTHTHRSLNMKQWKRQTGGILAKARRKIEPLNTTKRRMPTEIPHCRGCLPQQSLRLGTASAGLTFVTSHSELALITQHTNRSFLSDHINHTAVTWASIGRARTMWWAPSTPSLKSTRCII